MSAAKIMDQLYHVLNMAATADLPRKNMGASQLCEK